MLIDDFNHTIDIWLKELSNYNFTSLCTRPSSDSWSLGQVYMHIMGETNHFLEQIKICLSNNENRDEEMSFNAKIIFWNNGFPDEIIDGPSTNADTRQPDNKDEIIRSLLNLRKEFNTVAISLSKSKFHGKTKHPGLNYFTADEWLRFAEMHMRHHLRQKKRIDEFLKATNFD